MRSISGRVGKIEAARRDKRAQQEFKSYRLMQMICRCQVRESPGIERVRPEHTDPETYCDIQETLAWARGDYAQADRLRDLDPDKHVPPPPGTPWEEQMRLAREALDRCADEATDRTERVRAAIETAGA
jgi:hypothetical protein